MLITCSHDGTDQDSEICVQKRRSARLQRRRGKPITNPQCTNCKITPTLDVDPLIGTIVCEDCGTREKRINSSHKYCIDCRMKNASPRDRRKIERQKTDNKCTDCGTMLSNRARQTKRCLTCKRKADTVRQRVYAEIRRRTGK